MSALPRIEPPFDETSGNAILSDRKRSLRLVEEDDVAPADASLWVGSTTRRCFDCVVAACGLLAVTPFMAMISLLVRASSPGPVFFRQNRAGRNREAFTLYKFRSMRMDAAGGPAYTAHGDPRITAIGAFLRRYKLDELPQLLNVLKGDLSLVGPRPKLPHHEALALPYRPGVTGAATLAFRNEEEILAEVRDCDADSFYEICIKPRKAQLDRDYMRKATLWSDLRLLWGTACSCLLRSDRLPLDEAEKLKLIAAAWPDAPSRRAGAVATSREAANHVAPVELHGPRWPENYQAFDKAFEQES